MLDELFNRGLSSKCKSLIKLINSRLDTIKRKRNCSLRLLRKDVADLLTRGQEMKAFNRAEVLVAEQNLYTAYDMVEHFCASILSNLSVIQKQRECPPESMEAVASIMFAAARFADLPELRNLRGIFSERYGYVPTNSDLDLYTFPGCAVNKEFAELFSSKPPSTDRKMELMREISKESSINWDSKAFEERVKNPHASISVTAGKQSPHWNDGQKHGAGAHEKGNQNQSTHRKAEAPPENARPKNLGHDPIHAEVRQEVLSHRKSQQPMDSSSKTPPWYSDTIKEKDKRSHDGNSRKTEPPMQHMEEPDCVLNTLSGNDGRKEHSRRKSELSQGHATKSDRQRGDMLDEGFDPDALSHGRWKQRSDCETKEKWNGAADKRANNTLSSRRQPTLDISKDEAYERDERERLPHKSKPHFFTETTNKMHEGSYKGNAHETLHHGRMTEHHEQVTQRRKSSSTNDKAANMQETEDYTSAEYEIYRSEYGLDDRKEKMVHRPPYSYKTNAWSKIMPSLGNGHESREQDKQLHRSKPTYGRDPVAARMHGDANCREGDLSTFSPRSPLGDDQGKMLYKSKLSYAYNRAPEMVHEDTLHEGYDHENLSRHSRQPQFDNDREKRYQSSKSRYAIRTAKLYADAYDDENEQEILPQRNDSPLYDDQKFCHRSKPPFGYNGTLRLHDDTPYHQNSHETSPDRTYSPLGEKKEKLSRRSKSRPHTREADNISNDASCRAIDYETLLDESQSAFGIKEKIEDGGILRKGKPKAQKSEAYGDRLAELDGDTGRVPIGFNVHLRTNGREKSDSSKPSIKNVKPPYVITGQKVSYSEDADSRNDNQNTDDLRDLNTKGDDGKEMKPDHNRITRPPPYVASTKSGKPRNGADGRCAQDDEVITEVNDFAYRLPRTMRDRPVNHEGQGGRVSSFEQHREAIAERGTARGDKVPKPASVRQRHPQAFVNTDADYPLRHHMKHDRQKSTRMDQSEDDFHEPGYSRIRHKHREETSSGVDGYLVDEKPRHTYRRGVQYHPNDEDEEDEVMDELLLLYSQKVTPQVANDIQVGSNHPTAPVADATNRDTSATRRSARRAGSDPRSEPSHAPNRAVSLPPEQSQPEEKIKSHVRATSMQPDTYSGHVHPKLPDYDDLAVRFAALRQNNG
ncbi:unnamed protein product [Victoria cruziana]